MWSPHINLQRQCKIFFLLHRTKLVTTWRFVQVPTYSSLLPAPKTCASIASRLCRQLFCHPHPFLETLTVPTDFGHSSVVSHSFHHTAVFPCAAPLVPNSL